MEDVDAVEGDEVDEAGGRAEEGREGVGSARGRVRGGESDGEGRGGEVVVEEKVERDGLVVL